jgi:hypothetical protein
MVGMAGAVDTAEARRAAIAMAASTAASEVAANAAASVVVAAVDNDVA